MASNAAFQQTLYGWNQKLCAGKPVFTADEINAVDTQSIAFISRLELNTVGAFDAPNSFLTYGSDSFRAESCPQEGALSGPLPVDVAVPDGSGLEIAYYVLPLGGDTPANATLSIVWPDAEAGASGDVETVWVAGRSVRLATVSGPGVQEANGDGSAWRVTRDGLAAQQDIDLQFTNIGTGIAPHLVLYFFRPVA